MPLNIGTISNVLQYFGYLAQNSPALDVFIKVVKVMNHTGLWDTELAWYSLSATRQICLYGLEQGLGIHGFKLTWSCLVVEVLSIQVKFLRLFAYCTEINCTFTFCTTNILGCIRGVMAQFELVKHKFSG